MALNSYDPNSSDNWLTEQPDPQGDPFGAPGPDPFAPSSQAQAAPSAQPSSPAQPAAPQSGAYDMTGTGLNTPNQTANPAALRNQAQQTVGQYQSLMSQAQSATDPTSRATAVDALSRQLQGDLEADGHTVAWKNGQLVVDGRPYEVAGAVGDTGASTTPGQTQNTGVTGTGSPGGTGSSAQGGVGHDGVFNGQTREQWRDAWMSTGGGQTQQQVDAWMAANGAQKLSGNGTFLTPFGEVLDLGTAYRSGNVSAGWTPVGGGGGNGGSGAGGAGDTYQSWLDGGQHGTMPGMPPGWQPGQNHMFDGLFDTLDPNAGDLPGYDQIYQQLSQTSPTEQNTSDLVNRILQNPHSLSDQTIEMLKSKNAEELAGAQRLQDEDMQGFAGAAGQLDSPWLAAERGQSAWDRRSKTIDSNRNVDLGAAEQNRTDELNAAKLGQGFAGYQTAKAQTAINTAVQGALGKLGEQRTRTQMNNAFKEAAAQLGMSADQLQMAYIKNNNDFGIDMKKLSLQSSQFQQELAFRIQQLQQQDSQFGANYQLAADQFAANQDQTYWERARQNRLDARPTGA